LLQSSGWYRFDSTIELLAMKEIRVTATCALGNTSTVGVELRLWNLDGSLEAAEEKIARREDVAVSWKGHMDRNLLLDELRRIRRSRCRVAMFGRVMWETSRRGTRGSQ